IDRIWMCTGSYSRPGFLRYSRSEYLRSSTHPERTLQSREYPNPQPLSVLVAPYTPRDLPHFEAEVPSNPEYHYNSRLAFCCLPGGPALTTRHASDQGDPSSNSIVATAMKALALFRSGAIHYGIGL